MKKTLFEAELQSAGWAVPARQPLPKARGFCVKDQDSKNSEETREQLVQDFFLLSESAFNKIWLDPEEDEAWQHL